MNIYLALKVKNSKTYCIKGFEAMSWVVEEEEEEEEGRGVRGTIRAGETDSINI